ncbi:hypothetical protein [Pseudalkalibacillus caeni]|uniref:DUF3918 domain-containing protein n=1 Tax=Exobacillus caeni TaxID=2574798 RepID=A0A5R9EWM5_9BACL|nr:hypothetical protein [Pseudalkalibacillus caeni]TLS35642.1 hypothetical protein FCL54_19265 [Pseudalkalibacillus caeni]
MQNRGNIVPILASIGIGAAAYSMMKGRGGNGNMKNMMQGLSNMGGQNMLKNVLGTQNRKSY